MKSDSLPSTKRKNVLLSAIVYLLWFIVALISVAVVVQFQSTVVALWIGFGGDRYTLSFLNQVCILVGGLGAFIYVVFIEGYLRASISQSKKPVAHQNLLVRRLTNWGIYFLLKRFIIAIAIPSSLIVICFVVLEIGLSILVR